MDNDKRGITADGARLSYYIYVDWTGVCMTFII